MNAVRPLHIVSTLPHGFVGSDDLYTHPSGARVRRDRDTGTHWVLLVPPVEHAIDVVKVTNGDTKVIGEKRVALDIREMALMTHTDDLDEALSKALELWREIGVRR
jgi:hypothetical protein